MQDVNDLIIKENLSHYPLKELGDPHFLVFPKRLTRYVIAAKVIFLQC